MGIKSAYRGEWGAPSPTATNPNPPPPLAHLKQRWPPEGKALDLGDLTEK